MAKRALAKCPTCGFTRERKAGEGVYPHPSLEQCVRHLARKIDSIEDNRESNRLAGYPGGDLR